MSSESPRKLLPLAIIVLLLMGTCLCLSAGVFSYIYFFSSDSDADYYEAVEEVHGLLKTSPDNLPARAEALVAEEDAQGLFEWVRDEIALTPTAQGSFEQMTTFVRWGDRGALRAGQGTFREQADLLARLLREAGFEAEVVGPYRGEGVTADAIMEAFFRDRDRSPHFDISQAEAERLANRLVAGEGDAGEAHSFEEIWQLSQGLADRLLEMESGPNDGTYRVNARHGIPLVRVRIDGSHRYLNPAFADAQFSGVEDVEGLEVAAEASGLLEIEARLEVLVAGGDHQWRQLAEGSWSADELIGRRLSVGALAGVDASMMAGMRIGDLDVLTPFLMVQGSDLTQEETAELTVFGESIDVSGQWVGFDEETGQVARGMSTIEVDEGVDTSRVAEIVAEANGRSFPEIDLRLDVFDSDGRSLAGLSGSQFTIEEGGEPLSGRLLQNGGAHQRVLFLLDTSGSIPDEFRGAPMIDFAVEVSGHLRRAIGGIELAIIRVDNSRYHSRLNRETLWTTDLDELRAQGESAIARNGGSALWQNLAEASRLDPTVIVFINDGHNIGADNERVRDRVSMGPPALVVGVGPVDEEVLQEMANLSGGDYFQAMTAGEIASPLLQHLQNQEVLPYRLRYTAHQDGPSQRQVIVGIHGAGDVTGRAQYTIPERPAPSPALAGIRLRLSVGDVSVTRLLAGTDDEAAAIIPSEEIRNDVISTFLSPITVFFEGDAPPYSVWLDDYVAARLTHQDFVEAATAGDVTAALDTINDGFEVLPAAPFIANGPIPGALSAEARTFVQGMRVAIYRERVDMESGMRRTSFDILPTAQFATMRRAVYDGEDDGTTDYATTLRRTAWLALAEAATFSALDTPAEDGERGYSTWNLLKDEELHVFGPWSRITGRDVFPHLSNEIRLPWTEHVAPWRRNWRLFVPHDGQTMAMWVVHHRTGEMYGILPDGTGGADVLDRIQETMHKVDRFARFWSLYTMPLKLSPAIGVVQNYYIMLARMYAAVTITLATMSAADLSEDLREAVQAMACSSLEQLLFMPFPGISRYMTIINGILAIGDAPGISICALR